MADILPLYMFRVRDMPQPLESPAKNDRSKLDKWAFPAFLVVLTLLCLAHAIYFSKTKLLFASSDEAHYASGALTIANGLRSGTFSGAWQGYRAALGFKPPLVCVPAGILMSFTKSLTLPFCLTLIFIFAALGLASYSFFRN